MLEGVQIIFRNFTGRPGPFNQEGDRNFGVLLDEVQANGMTEDGWNVKWLEPREDVEEEVEPRGWLPCFLKYHGRNGPVRPPTVVLVTSRGRTNLGEDEVKLLDFADIINVDLIVRPFSWEINNKTGVKAMVKSLFVTIDEDPLQKKYAEMDIQ